MHIIGEIVVYIQRNLLIFASWCPGPNVCKMEIVYYSFLKGKGLNLTMLPRRRISIL